jgi:hypothetical protein
MNKFSICTMNGISTWGDDFSLKSNPISLYLDARNNLLLGMIFNSKTRSAMCRMIWNFFYAQLTSYTYASAASVSLALKHISEGPKFFKENIDMKSIFPIITNHPIREELVPISRADLDVTYFNAKRKSKFQRLIQKLSFNGSLLPDRFKKNKIILAPKNFAADRNVVYRFKKVFYEYDPLGLGFIATFDRNLFISELWMFIKQIIVFWFSYYKLLEEYRISLGTLTSRKFWEEVYTETSETKLYSVEIENGIGQMTSNKLGLE